MEQRRRQTFLFFLPTEKQVLFDLLRKEKLGRTDYFFFLLALIVSKLLGTNDAMRASFSPTLECTVAIINLVIYDSNLQSLPWAIHLLFKKKEMLNIV